MSATAEALALVALLPDAAKYQQKLQELIDKTNAANAAVANLAAKEKAAADKIAVAETVLASLNEQADALKSAQEAAEGKLASAEADLARRLGELETAKAAHADQVKNSLQMFAAREAELKQRQSALDVDFHRRLEDLRGVENKLRDHHSGLRSIIGAARQGLAAAS